MTIALGSLGTAATGTTSLSVALPSGIVAGDLLVLAIANKYPSNGPSTPSGYTFGAQATGGQGSAGADSGQTFCTVYYRVADGTESGNVAVTITSGNVSVGRLIRYTGDGAGWNLAFAVGDDASAGTSWSVTATSNPGIQADDFLLAFGATNSDAGTASAEAMSATGLVFASATEIADTLNGSGDDCSLLGSQHPVTSGIASAAPVWTATLSAGSGTGGAVFVRVRESGVRFAGVGTNSSGSGSVPAVGYPAVIVLGDLLVLAITNKYPPNGPTTPSGWTLQVQASGGTGFDVLDSGNVFSTIYTRVADGTETGTFAVTVTSGNSSTGRIARYRLDPGQTWALATASGADSSADTAWSVTAGADPGLAAGDTIFAATSSNTDVASFSGDAFAATGCTFSTASERSDTTTPQGDDSSLLLTDAKVLTGPSSAPLVFTATASASGAFGPAGASTFLRMRQVPLNSDGAAAGTSTATGVGAATAAATGAVAGTSTAAAAGVAIAPASAVAAGTSTAAAIGTALAAAAGAAAGVAAADDAPAVALAIGAGATAGAATALAVGSSTAEADASATGTATATAAGVSSAVASGAAAGVADAQAEALAITVAAGVAAGSSTAAAPATALAPAAGAAAGVSTALAAGGAIGIGAGVAAGEATALATGFAVIVHVDALAVSVSIVGSLVATAETVSDLTATGEFV